MKDFSCKEMKLFYSLTLDLLMGKNQFHSSGVDRGIRVISCPPSRHTPTSYCIIQFSPTIIDLGNVCFTGFLMDVSFSSIATYRKFIIICNQGIQDTRESLFHTHDRNTCQLCCFLYDSFQSFSLFFLQRAFDALCHSTHLYGRRLVLEWAESAEDLDQLRKKTAEHFHDGK